MKATMILALCLAAGAANAQVYKCQDAGQVVFSDRPCSADAQPQAVRPASGAYDPTAGAKARYRAETAKRMAVITQKMPVARTTAPDNCAKLRDKHDEAMKWADEFTSHANVALELAKAARARERLFFECGPEHRVSAFD